MVLTRSQHRRLQTEGWLPGPALLNVLQRVPVKQRMSSCALVCTAWASAAAAATTTVTLGNHNNCTLEKVAALHSWVCQHAQQLVSVQAPKHAPDRRHPFPLPCAQLKRLHTLQLHMCNVVLASTSSSSMQQSSPQHVNPGLQLPALQDLRLTECAVHPSFLAAVQMPKLTTLQLHHTQKLDTSTLLHVCAVVPALLQRLPQLLVLELSVPGLRDTALDALSSLQHLQSFSIQGCKHVTPHALSALSSNLTSLAISGCTGVFTAATLSASRWPHLKRISLCKVRVLPAVLGRHEELQELSLTGCSLYPEEEDEDWSILGRAADGARDLLKALAQLTQLKSLDLSNIHLTAIHDHHNTQYDLHDLFLVPMLPITFHHLRPFSALTASTQLQRLSLSYRDVDMKVQPLPRFTLRERMLRPGRPLLGLTELVIDALDPDYLADSTSIKDDEIAKRFVAFWFLEPWDINVIAVSCPNLKHLTLNCVLAGCGDDAEEALKGLVMLQERLRLQTLCLGGPWIYNEHAAVLGTMTTLTALELHNAPWLRSKGLQRLVALQQLRRLELHYVGHCRDIDLCLVTSQNPGKPDVWRQLTQQLPAIAAAQEVLGAEPKDDWDVDESLLRGYDADDTAWYDSWAESDTEEEDDDITDDSGAAEAPWWTSESSGADAYIELTGDEVEGDEEEDSSEEDSEAVDSV